MNQQIHEILDKARQSLDAARLLLDQGYTDFAASRAYYAMFYTAEALLLQRGLSFSSHAAVIANYGKEFSKTKDINPEFHKYLIAAQDFRSQGDYGYGPSVSEGHAQDAIKWADDFLNTAAKYLKGT